MTKISDAEFDIIKFIKRNGPITLVKLKLYRRRANKSVVENLVKQNLLQSKINYWNELVYFVE